MLLQMDLMLLELFQEMIQPQLVLLVVYMLLKIFGQTVYLMQYSMIMLNAVQLLI